MKLFWSLIAAIVLSAAAYLALGMLRGEPTPPRPEPAPPAPSADQTPSVPNPVEQAAQPAPTPTPANATNAQPADATTTDAVPAEPVNADPLPESQPPPTPPAPEADIAPAPPPEQEPIPPPPAESAVPATGDAPEAPAEASPALPAEVNVEKRDDGSLLIDGKYAVTGDGTKEKPYKLSWDLLLSVGHDYAPRDGKKSLPGRITMFDGTWVELTGYIAFPLMTDKPDELLSMMNQWDGCCIGIPPTPYDAIEVRLATAVTGAARFTTFGTVAGKFKVEPSLVGNWVVGLYIMDGASMTPKAYGGMGP